jgi:flagellar P-ring protein precursor FlgI
MYTSASILRPSLHGVLLIVLFAALAAPAAAQESRLKELVTIEGATPTQLTGYGLVVGLDRTGDRVRGQRGAPQTVQSIVNMLERFGITVDPSQLTARNAAAVMVTAVLDPYLGPGSLIDVTVSAIGDARSLSGGILLQTPLLSPANGTPYAMAQGPVSTGAILAATSGARAQVNHTNTGRIPGGALVTNALPLDLLARDTLGLILKHPDFTTATRIVAAINTAFPDAASASHAGRIQLFVPEDEDAPSFFASLEELPVEVDIPARFVINERTGTIVAGGNVRISEVMVTYGSIMITTQSDPYVSQPGPLSGGETVSGTVGSASIEEEGTRSVVLPSNTNVNQLAAALNDLGLTARDVIAIFQAIDRAGALQGDLIIL